MKSVMILKNTSTNQLLNAVSDTYVNYCHHHHPPQHHVQSYNLHLSALQGALCAMVRSQVSQPTCYWNDIHGSWGTWLHGASQLVAAAAKRWLMPTLESIAPLSVPICTNTTQLFLFHPKSPQESTQVASTTVSMQLVWQELLHVTTICIQYQCNWKQLTLQTDKRNNIHMSGRTHFIVSTARCSRWSNGLRYIQSNPVKQIALSVLNCSI